MATTIDYDPARERPAALQASLAGTIALVLAAWPAPATAACIIENSACYPWRIGEAARETVLLKAIPNNSVTSLVYRVCLCPPQKSVSVVFDFYRKEVEIGAVEVESGNPVCRDFRIETSRRSRLLLRRAEAAKTAVEGCYTAFPALP